MEEIRGKGIVNVMEGLELHLGVLLETEQALLERQILEWVRLGHQVIFPSLPSTLLLKRREKIIF